MEEFEERAEYQNKQWTRTVGDRTVPYTAHELLNEQIQAMKYGDKTTYQTALDYVEGGSLLVYYYDVQQFLDGLGINPTGKEYTNEKSWRLYCHLVAREITKMLEA
jgi:hypothetical protein